MSAPRPSHHRIVSGPDDSCAVTAGRRLRLPGERPRRAPPPAGPTRPRCRGRRKELHMLAAAESRARRSRRRPRRDTGRAMAQENVELVREIIAAVPNWHEVSALLHPDARFDQTRIPDGGVYERWFGTWDEIRMTPERFIEDGDRVLALMTIEGRGKSSGVPVVIHSADLFTIRDGKIISLVGYPDRAEALADIGESE